MSISPTEIAEAMTDVLDYFDQRKLNKFNDKVYELDRHGRQIARTTGALPDNWDEFLDKQPLEEPKTYQNMAIYGAIGAVLGIGIGVGFGALLGVGSLFVAAAIGAGLTGMAFANYGKNDSHFLLKNMEKQVPNYQAYLKNFEHEHTPAPAPLLAGDIPGLVKDDFSHVAALNTGRNASRTAAKMI